MNESYEHRTLHTRHVSVSHNVRLIPFNPSLTSADFDALAFVSTWAEISVVVNLTCFSSREDCLMSQCYIVYAYHPFGSCYN